jgi:hypothetical protein
MPMQRLKRACPSPSACSSIEGISLNFRDAVSNAELIVAVVVMMFTMAAQFPVRTVVMGITMVPTAAAIPKP